MAPVAFVPLTHKATLRVVLAREAPEAADLPDAEQVAAGWRAQGDVGSCWALPEPTITAAADAARGFLLVHDEPDLAITAWLAEARHQLGLRDEQGFRSGLVTGQRLSGRIPDVTDSEASTGQALVAFVTLKTGIIAKPELREELRQHVGKEIGPVAKPDDLRFAEALPKTRSGKIMRRLLKQVASGVEVKGDTTTLEDYNVLAHLSQAAE